MMQLHANIRYLLSEEGRVSLPGVGVLTAFYEPAGADLSEDKFIPSSQRLHFNASDEPVENLLRQLAHLHGKSDARLQTEVEEFRDSLKSQLEKQAHCIVPGIGKIKKVRGGKLVFEPDPAFNAFGNSFGLESFSLKKVKNAKAEKKADGTEVQKKGKGDWSWLIAFIIAIFIAGGIYFWATRYFDPTCIVKMYFTPSVIADQEGTQESEGQFADTAKPEMNTEDTASFVIDSAAEYPADTMLVSNDTIEEEKEAADKVENFFIVAGVFRTNKGLNRTLERLEAMGYPAKVFKTTSSGARYVCYDGYETRAQAEAALEGIREKANPEAWIWPQR